jgi:hypothetical protein
VKPVLAAAIGACALLLEGDALAQTARPDPIARADVLGVVGWLHVDRSDLDPYDYGTWVNRIGFAGGGMGWYWTDHLKTEVDAGVSSSATRYVPRVLDIDGHPVYGSSRYTFSSRHLAISQQYQFFRNVWFHPHLSAGIDFTWRETGREDEPSYTFDPVTRQSRFVAERSFPPTTDVLTRPFAGAGFKAYVSERSFFRLDMRLTFRDGVEQVLFRFGFGADF